MHIELRAFLSLLLSSIAIIIAGWVSLFLTPVVALIGEREKFKYTRVASLGVCNSLIGRKLIRRLMKGVVNGRVILAEFDEAAEDVARAVCSRLQEDDTHAQAISGLGQEELCLVLEDMSPEVFILVLTEDVSRWFKPLMAVLGVMRAKRRGLIVVLANDASASMSKVFIDGLRGLVDADGVCITYAAITASDFDRSVIDAIRCGHPLVVHPLSITDLVSDSLTPFRSLVN